VGILADQLERVEFGSRYLLLTAGERARYGAGEPGGGVGRGEEEERGKGGSRSHDWAEEVYRRRRGGGGDRDGEGGRGHGATAVRWRGPPAGTDGHLWAAWIGQQLAPTLPTHAYGSNDRTNKDVYMYY
jgi:hypothetical protein